MRQKKPNTSAAQNLAQAPRGNLKLANFVRQDVPELKIKAGVPSDTGTTSSPNHDAKKPGTNTPDAEKTTPEDSTQKPAKQEEGDSAGGCQQVPTPGHTPSTPLWLLLGCAALVAQRRLSTRAS